MVIYCPYFLEQKQKKGKIKLACTVAAKLGIEGDQYRPKDLNPTKTLEESEELLFCIACRFPNKPEKPLNDCPQREYYKNGIFRKTNMNLGNYLKKFGY